MDILLHSFTLVTFAEIGDKTQFLSILLAARFRTFLPIILGIVTATLLNHAGAAYLGVVLSDVVPTYWVARITAVLFIGIGLWVLIPDKEPVVASDHDKYGAFLTSVFVFFLGEMGDKTQLATITLGMEYNNIMLVTLGTTLGMLAANIPAVLLGKALLDRIPLTAVRMGASLLFIGYGVYVLIV